MCFALQDGAPDGASDDTAFASPVPGHKLTDSSAVVNVEGEQSLIVIRASSGSTDLSLGGGHFSTSLAVGAFEIEDLLVGKRCPDHGYLARSFVVTREHPAHLSHLFCALICDCTVHAAGRRQNTSHRCRQTFSQRGCRGCQVVCMLLAEGRRPFTAKHPILKGLAVCRRGGQRGG